MNNQTKSTKKSNRKFKFIIRVVVSVILLVFFASKVNLSDTASLLYRTNYLILFACILLYLVAQSVSAYKWSIISSAIGFSRKFSEYVQFYFIGMFFNLFLPSTIGGDVGKAYYLSKGDTSGRKAPAIYTVLAERFSGLAVLVWIGAIALWTPIAANVPSYIRDFATGLSLLIIVGTPLFPLFIKSFFNENNWLNRSMMNDVLVFWDHKIVIRCLGWSLLFHVIVVAIHILIGSAMHLNVPVFYYFALYPIVAIIGFLPVAFNGIGVREGAYIYLLGFAGVSHSAGLAFGLLWFIILVVTSLVGGVVFIKGHHTPPPEEYEESEFEFDVIPDDTYNQSSQGESV